jgi:hypothetical protein
MNTSSLKSIGSIIVLTAAAHLPAAQPGEASMNEFRIGPSFGFNITAKFSGFQPVPLPPSPAAGPLADRNYTDGYVRVDSSANADNRTWNWGYQNNAQYDQAASAIDLHALAVNAESSSEQTGNPSYGFELSYLRRLGENPNGHFAVELAFGYNRLDIADDSAHPVNATITTDSFPLGGVIPPLAPYEGTFSGPGALLGATPARASALASGSLSGSRSTTADIYNFRLGPVFMLPLGEKVRLELATGLAVALVDNQFSFSETLTVNGISETRSGSGGGVDTILGPYVRGGIRLALSPSWSVFAGAQYQYLTDVIKQTAAGTSVELDFRQAIYATVGVGYNF